MKLLAIYILTFLGILGLGIWWQVYKFSDCRNVGHSRLYCVMDIGK